MIKNLTKKKILVRTTETADTIGSKTKGLMFRKSLADDSGMLFIFGYERRHEMWMFGMRFPIDIIFIDSKLFIRTIWKSVPPCVSEPCPTYPSGVKIKYVLEASSGFCEKFGVKENQKVEFVP